MISAWLNKRKLSKIQSELEKHSLSEVCQFITLFPPPNEYPYICPFFDNTHMLFIGVPDVDVFFANWKKFQTLKLFL